MSKEEEAYPALPEQRAGIIHSILTEQRNPIPRHQRLGITCAWTVIYSKVGRAIPFRVLKNRFS